MEFAALAGFSQDQIFAGFGVPKSKVGLVADANRANAEAADLTFNRETILPKLTLIDERIEADLLPMYPGQDQKAWLEVGFENPVPTDREQARQEMESRLRNYVTAVNEEREALSLEPAPWGGVPLVPLTVMPLGSYEASTPPPPQTPPEEPRKGQRTSPPRFLPTRPRARQTSPIAPPCGRPSSRAPFARSAVHRRVGCLLRAAREGGVSQPGEHDGEGARRVLRGLVRTEGAGPPQAGDPAD